MDDRTLMGYWAVWTHGLEWPELFYDETAAKARAHILAKDRLGYTVHVCKIESIGTISIPHNLNLAGVMVEGETLPPPM